MERSRITQKRKKRRKKGLLKIFALTVLILILGAAGYSGYLAYSINETAKDSYKEIEKSDLRMEDVALGEDPVTILVVGIEDYAGGKGRADVIQLYSINPKTKEKVVVSIPRDTRAYIEEVGYKDKITHSYSYGGIEATIDTVENLLDVPIDYYVTTNFKGFEDTVDALGGITVDVPFDFKYYDTDGRWVTFEEGKMKLDGREALAFVRMRKDDPQGDFGRNKRQQEAISAMMEKATSFSTITKVDNVLDSLGDNVTTNITIKEMFALRNFYKDLLSKGFEKLTVKGENAYIDGIYFYEPDDESIDKISRQLRDLLEITNQPSGENEEQNSEETTYQ
ncbi:LCP family protein [Pseudalkalibacillus decolorationis]|uniref:LCP family protein n=1 Tax=Pseudalkalibacillus decolorationis TaxID=163879 RepID=UPI002147ABD2|nr:LCP family protein [Pseudalkalibacillus decolorationis]